MRPYQSRIQKKKLATCTLDSYQFTMHFAAMVLNVVVELLPNGSVNVTWDDIGTPEVEGYVVYYNLTEDSGGNFTEQSVTTHDVNPNSTNFVVFGDLIDDEEYNFQVAAIAEIKGERLIGERSLITNTSIIHVTLPERVSTTEGAFPSSVQTMDTAMTTRGE